MSNPIPVLQQADARLTASTRLFQRQPALREALAAALGLPPGTTSGIAFLRAAIAAFPPEPSLDRPVVRIAIGDAGDLSIAVDDDLIDYVVRCLGNARPINVIVERTRKAVWARIASDCRITRISSKIDARSPADQAERMRRLGPIIVLGRREDHWRSAFVLLQREVYQSLGNRTELCDIVVRVLADGRCDIWCRKTDRDCPCERADAPGAMRDMAYALCRNLEARGFTPVADRCFATWSVSMITPRAPYLPHELQDSHEDRKTPNYLEWPTLLSIVKRAMRIAVATSTPAMALAITRLATYRMLMKPNSRRPHLDPTSLMWRSLPMLGHGEPVETLRLQQAVAIAPALLQHASARKAAAAGRPLAKAIADAIIEDGHRQRSHDWSDGTAPVLTKDRLVNNRPLLERAMRLAAPHLKTLCTQVVDLSYFEYAQVMVAVGARNPHIRPRSAMEVLAIADAFKPGSTTVQGPSRTDTMMARTVAARLHKGRVMTEPRDLHDVTKWLAQAFAFISGVEPMDIDCINQGEYSRDPTSALVDAAAIRMGGWTGLVEIDRRWHAASRDFNHERLDLLNPDVRRAGRAEELASILTLPPAEIGGVSLRCLVTERDLVEEGDQLRHCVGGYSIRVACGESFIVSLRSDLAPSTAELIMTKNDGKLRFSVTQHRSFDNNPAPERHNTALERYVSGFTADQPRMEALWEARLEANSFHNDARMSPYAKAYGRPALRAKLLEMLARQIASILLPASMAAASAEEILAYAQTAERVEHLTAQRQSMKVAA